ncbi:MAG: hypothetical protein FIA99_04930 [Ruminiclostridium sp.]|nr:hypothetical protein [Ruminiclostridium sp.]
MAANRCVMWRNGCWLFVLAKLECGRFSAARMLQTLVLSHGWRMTSARINTTSLISFSHSIVMSDVVCRVRQDIISLPMTEPDA